ncbi:MAG: phenylalanine--tRNA ligase subunit alpha [Nitriliruptorales bacterium]|nr:phenylalanine--tRNA ligase subunit alpha [Nitriliruptorales bacterium]
MPSLDEITASAIADIAAASSTAELEEARIRWTGRKSDLASVGKQMKDLEPAKRKQLGQELNAAKTAIEDALATRHDQLAGDELEARLAAEALDLTLPPRVVPAGRPHLLTLVERRIVDIFVGLGYRVADGPEVEDGTYVFDMLNIPPDHPARQEMDTIYVAGSDDLVLRTHTSPVQVRTMLAQEPPIAVVVPGRVYRADTVDATHSPVFTQVEGLLVAEGITMADLRGTLLAFARALFGDDRQIRMRPSMFPFVEPGAEVDVSWGTFEASDATRWLEILGCGMVDPLVLEMCGIDPGRHSGFAFGIGVERVAMLAYGVDDIRDLYEGDLRFLQTSWPREPIG